ncbi:MAG: hypothetical protein JWM34_3345 [Ilumatobacteraceae bacterium]|nr:hypothetical protein [Ilumatobacteraceae bacterium]
MTTAVEITLAAEPDAWRAVGFAVDPDGVVALGGIAIRLSGAGAGDGGITGWVLADAPRPDIADIDGLPTTHAAPGDLATVTQPNGVDSIDHIVVYTPDLERTCAAVEHATGEPLKRIREVGQLRQGFHRLGPLIVEVVNFPGIDAERAVFWGLALNVVDIDGLYERCGAELMSAPKDAVQQGRRIASFREVAGLGTPVAVMTPHVRA